MHFATKIAYLWEHPQPKEDKPALVALSCPLQPSDRQPIFSFRLIYKLATLFVLSIQYKNLPLMNLKANFWITYPPGPTTHFTHLLSSWLVKFPMQTHTSTQPWRELNLTLFLPWREGKDRKTGKSIFSICCGYVSMYTFVCFPLEVA